MDRTDWEKSVSLLEAEVLEAETSLARGLDARRALAEAYLQLGAMYSGRYFDQQKTYAYLVRAVRSDPDATLPDVYRNDSFAIQNDPEQCRRVNAILPRIRALIDEPPEQL